MIAAAFDLQRLEAPQSDAGSRRAGPSADPVERLLRALFHEAGDGVADD
jgi:hypothetical protein